MEVGQALLLDVDVDEHDARLHVVGAVVGAGRVGQPPRVGLGGDELALGQVLERMPSTPLMASSSGIVTAFSTVAAFAPT